MLNFNLKNPIKNFLSNENIKEIFLKNSKLSFNLNLKKKEILFQENILLITKISKV